MIKNLASRELTFFCLACIIFAEIIKAEYRL